MKIKCFIILSFLTLLSLKNFATHIVGGEIYYDCLGGNNYRITLKLYRDCYNGLAPYDNPASVFIFNSAGVFIDSLEVPFPGSVVLPIVLNNPCLVPPTNVCVEEAIYQVVVNLPPIAGGYNITYQRCCRNGTILNLISPGAVGATYMAHIPDASVAVANSSPHYDNFPPIFLCAGVPLNFDHSATDPDGDSLYYALCDPFTGLSASCPILGVPGANSGCPGIASPPPYSYVPWAVPYSGSYPMSSSPALAVNPVTGLMTGTPNMIGQWVVGVCVSEYRNGVLIDVNKRDFQFNVVNCGLPVASIPVQQPFCFGSPSHFTQNSVNAFSYHWDFGDPGTVLDTSNIFAPTWTYANLGTYTLTLIVNPGTSCTDTATMSVTVNPLPAMTNGTTATICSGGTVSIPLTSSLASTYSWIASNNPNTTGESTSAQTGSTLSNTITNNTSSVQTVTYTITPTSNPQGCPGTPQTVTVTVNPAPAMTSPASAVICNGGTVSIPLTSNNASTYTWIAANNLNTTGESITLQTGSPLSNTITNNTAAIQTVTYTVTPTSTVGNCGGNPQTVTVTLMPTPAMTSTAVSTICNGGTVSIPLTSNVTSTYSWIAANNVNTTGESLTAQTGSPLTNTIANTTASVQIVAYTVTPTSSSGSCLGTPQTVNVSVNPSPTMTSAGAATICSGNAVNIALTANMSSVYTWIAVNNTNTTGESTSIQTGSPLNNTITNNTSVVQTVTYIVTPTSSPQGCLGTPQTVSVTVNPAPAMTSPTSATICNGGTATIPLTSNNASAYTWIAANNSNTTGESITLQTGSPISNTITNNTSSVQTVTYTVTPTSAPGGCLGAPQIVTVSVMPTPAMTSVSAATICNGGTVNIPLTSNVTSAYSWIAANNINTTGESITIQTGSPLSNTINNTTSSVQTVTYTVTPTSTTANCPGTPQTVTVSINPSPTMTSAAAAPICNGGTVSIPLTSNMASTYSWVAADNLNTSGESLTAQTGSPLSNTIFNNTTLVQTVTYTVTPTSSPQGCLGTTQIVTVTLNPSPTMTNADSTAICNGTTVNIPLSSTMASTYTWIAVNNPNISGESTSLQTGSPLNNTLTNTSSSLQSVIYTVTPTLIVGTCPGIPQIITVTVIPPPAITSVADTAICNGNTINIAFTSNVPSAYSWIASDNPNTSGESITAQTGSPLSNTLINNTASVEIVTYTVTPTSSPEGCLGIPQTLNVSVNPSPAMTSSDSAVVCNGAVVSIPLTSNMTSIFEWIAADNVNTSGESITTQTGSPLSNTLSNNTTVIQTVTYTVTPTSSQQGCLGIPQTVFVTLNPSPTMTSIGTATICNGTEVNIPLTSTMASTYEWIAADNANTTGESISLQTGSPLNDSITNTSSAVQSVIYTVTPTLISGTCPGIPQIITVTVILQPAVTSPISASICTGEMVSIPLTSNVTSTYTWIAADNANTSGESITAQSGSPLSDIIINNTAADQTVTYTVTPTSSPDGCLGIAQTLTVTVFNGITADFDFVTVPCTNQASFYDSSAAAPVSWLWYFDDGDSSMLQNPQHTYGTAGTYNVQLITSTINGCKDTVIVQADFAPLNPVVINHNDTICRGNGTQLFASGGFSYLWSPPISLSNPAVFNPFANPDTTTLYSVTIATVNTFGDTCSQILTTSVYVLDQSLFPITATADNDTIFEGQSTIIHAVTDSSLTVIWQPPSGFVNPNSLNQTVAPENTTTYTVSILDSIGCPKTGSVTVYVMSMECRASDVFVPNTFTPNGDGNNDILYVRAKEIKELYFAVYNRRGELVFETKDMNKGWDGIYKGAKADPDVFAWYLSAKCFSKGEFKSKGNVTLIR